MLYALLNNCRVCECGSICVFISLVFLLPCMVDNLPGRVKVVRLALEEPTDGILTSMQSHVQYVKTSTLQ